MKKDPIRIPVGRLLRAALCAAAGIVCLSSAPALGGYYSDGIWIPDGVCMDCGSPPSKYFPPPPPPERDYEAERRQQLRDEAFAANQTGIRFYLYGDREKAVAAFEEAANKDPDDGNIRQNLSNAKAAGFEISSDRHASWRQTWRGNERSKFMCGTAQAKSSSPGLNRRLGPSGNRSMRGKRSSIQVFSGP